MKVKLNFLLNAIGGSVYALTSMLYLIIVTRINGVDVAGDFALAFTFSCLIICIGNYSTRAFQVTERDRTLFENDFIFHKCFTCCLMIIGALLFIVFNDYDFNKSVFIILLTFYKILESVSETYYAIMQKNEELFKVGISFIIKSVVGTIIFLLVNMVTMNLILALILLFFSTLLVFIFYDFQVVKKYNYRRTKFSYFNIMKLFKIGFFQFSVMFLSLYVINSSKYAIDILLDSDKQAVFNILFMPTTIILMFSQYLIQPFLNHYNSLIKQSKFKEFLYSIIKTCSFVLILSIVGILCAWFIGIPVLEFVYGIDLLNYKLQFIILIIGGFMYSIVFIISTSLTILRVTKIQSLLYLLSTIITFILSYFLVMNFSLFGASISYLFTMLFLFISYATVFLFVILKKR